MTGFWSTAREIAHKRMFEKPVKPQAKVVRLDEARKTCEF